MAERFFVDQPLGLGSFTVQGPEAHHLANVCRLRMGDSVQLFNGDGREYSARVVAIDRRTVTLEVGDGEQPCRELSYVLEIAAPLPKGDRATFLVEKLTELGVSTFTPLQTARSVVLPREAKLERLHRHVIEASKQCGRNVLMQICPLTQFADMLVRPNLPPRKFIAHPGGASSPAGQGDAIALVGPEGGFTDDEVAAARRAGWSLAALGPRVLRVETAAIALAILCGAAKGAD
jgi:16S rRNA (uracil1498-N3)-methyltransferase